MKSKWEVRINATGNYDVILPEKNGYRLIGHCTTLEAARFLAAGPDMAKALEMLLAIDSQPQENKMAVLIIAIVKARAALKKAGVV